MKKTVASVLAIALTLTSAIGIVNADSIVKIGDYSSGDTLIAVNTSDYDYQAGTFNLSGITYSQSSANSISASSQTSTKADSLENDSEPSDEPEIMGYDNEGNGLIDPNDRLSNKPVPQASRSVTPKSTEINSVRNLFVDISSDHDNDTELEFTAAYIGTYCVVWTPTDSTYYPLTPEEAAVIGAEFDKNYETMAKIYGTPGMDPDGDGKIGILCYDIDGNGLTGSPYIGGYFSFNDIPARNIDCIHMDSAQGMHTNGEKDLDKSFGTLTHEFQHLLTYTNIRHSYADLPLFIDESFSESSTHHVFGDNQKRIDLYNSNTNSIYSKGQPSLFVWAYGYTYNGENVEVSALYSYPLAYFFGMYLSTHYDGGTSVYKDFATKIQEAYNQKGSRLNEHECTEVLANLMGYSDFNTLYKNFSIALVAKNSAGPHGYNGEAWADKITVHYASDTPQSNLIPPGGMISYIVKEGGVPSANSSVFSFVTTKATDITPPTVFGDVNYDGYLNSSDLQWMFENVYSPSGILFEAPLLTADLNYDNYVNSSDLQYLFELVFN